MHPAFLVTLESTGERGTLAPKALLASRVPEVSKESRASLEILDSQVSQDSLECQDWREERVTRERAESSLGWTTRSLGTRESLESRDSLASRVPRADEEMTARLEFLAHLV